jgi:site-specific DNA recombinase
MNKQAAIYARVSTDDQAEHGYSLPTQIEACQQFAWQRGFDVAAVYQDDISGAKPITHRPEGGELRDAINARQIDVVIVYHVDRLSRDIVDLLATVRDWLRLGVEIFALDVGQVTSELDIVLVIKGWQGSDERQKIRERTMRGRTAKAKAGKVVGGGSPPYGYTYSNGELLVDNPKAEIVRMIFDWYINGDENGSTMNLVAIAQRLTDMGIPTPSSAHGWQRKQGKPTGWSNVLIRRLIISETYCGVWRYGKYINRGGKGGTRPIEEQIAVPVPAIVSREMWERAQARRAYNSKLAKRKMKHEYLLRGLIYCGCGRRMIGGGRNREDNFYYYCPRRYSCGTAAGSDLCREPLVKGEMIEWATWEYIINLVKDPQQFAARLRQAQAKEAATMQPKQRELEHIIALLIDTEKEADEIARAAMKVKGIVGQRLEQQAEEIDQRYQALVARQTELLAEMNLELTDSNIDNLLEFREAVALGLENPTKEDKRQWLEFLQTEVTVTDGIAAITCRLGGTSLFGQKTSGYGS